MNVTLPCFQGGGLYIASGGVANLNNCDIYQNTADYVRARILNLP